MLRNPGLGKRDNWPVNGQENKGNRKIKPGNEIETRWPITEAKITRIQPQGAPGEGLLPVRRPDSRRQSGELELQKGGQCGWSQGSAGPRPRSRRKSSSRKGARMCFWGNMDRTLRLNVVWEGGTGLRVKLKSCPAIDFTSYGLEILLRVSI